jgi:hypothetical protein
MVKIEAPLEQLTGQWIGHFNGTTIGNVYAVFEVVRDSTSVKMHISSNGSTTVIKGAVDKAKAPPSATLLPEDFTADDAKSGVERHSIEITFDVIETGRILGRWESGKDAGVFSLAPANTQTQQLSDTKLVEIVSRNLPLPRLSLFRSDLQDISAKLKEMIKTPNDVVISTRIDGTDTLQLAGTFFVRTNLPSETERVHLSLQEAKALAPKSIVVDFPNEGAPSITINGDDRMWVSGAAQDLERFFRRYHSKWLGGFQKYALNFNGILLLIALGALPSLPTAASRYIMLASALALAFGFKKFHDHINRVRVFLKKNRSDKQLWDKAAITSAIAGTLAAAGISVIAGFLSENGLGRLLDWLANSFGH